MIIKVSDFTINTEYIACVTPYVKNEYTNEYHFVIIMNGGFSFEVKADTMESIIIQHNQITTYIGV